MTLRVGIDRRAHDGCCQVAARMPAAGLQPSPAEGGGARAEAGSGVRLGAGGVIVSGAGDATRWLGGAGGGHLVLEELAVPFLQSQTQILYFSQIKIFD